MADIRIENHGSIMLLHPLTTEAWAWVEDNLPDDRQEWCGGVVVEPRYVANIVTGMQDDGLEVES